jgi:hypothetical protein
MASLVIELEKDCLNPAASVPNLLRKSLVLATKLNLPEFVKWIQNEQNGYQETHDPIPPYRIVIGEVHAQDRWGRWIPVVFDNAETREIVSKVSVVDSIAEIESLLENAIRENLGRPNIPFEPEHDQLLAEGSLNRLTRHTRFIRLEDLRGILEAVRNNVLSWCLKLEKDGIVGEGLTFSKEEQDKAATRNYTTFHIGTMSQSQIQHATSSSFQAFEVSTFKPEAAARVVAQLREHISDLSLNPDQQRQIEADTKSVEMQLQAPKPSHGVIREAFHSIRNVLEQCAGNLLASGLIHEIGRLGMG